MSKFEEQLNNKIEQHIKTFSLQMDILGKEISDNRTVEPNIETVFEALSSLYNMMGTLKDAIVEVEKKD